MYREFVKHRNFYYLSPLCVLFTFSIDSMASSNDFCTVKIQAVLTEGSRLSAYVLYIQQDAVIILNKWCSNFQIFAFINKRLGAHSSHYNLSLWQYVVIFNICIYQIGIIRGTFQPLQSLSMAGYSNFQYLHLPIGAQPYNLSLWQYVVIFNICVYQIWD